MTTKEDPRTSECELHIFQDEDGWGWNVWLDPVGPPFGGVCIGAGPTREEAVAQAVRELEFALDELRLDTGSSVER